MELTDYKDLLLKLKEANPKIGFVCVAGGAVRDLLLNRGVKDIDIFYTGEIENLPEKWDSEEFAPLEENPYEDGGDFTVTHKEVWAPHCGKPIQLIHVEDNGYLTESMWADSLIATFPCSLSQVAIRFIVNTMGAQILEISNTNMFINHYWERNNKTKNHPVWFSDDCPEKYKQKIMKKYKDWMIPKKPLRILNARTNVGLGSNNVEQGVAV